MFVLIWETELITKHFPYLKKINSVFKSFPFPIFSLYYLEADNPHTTSDESSSYLSHYEKLLPGNIFTRKWETEKSSKASFSHSRSKVESKKFSHRFHFHYPKIHSTSVPRSCEWMEQLFKLRLVSLKVDSAIVMLGPRVHTTKSSLNNLWVDRLRRRRIIFLATIWSFWFFCLS